jgi:hypothetical protein
VETPPRQDFRFSGTPTLYVETYDFASSVAFLLAKIFRWGGQFYIFGVEGSGNLSPSKNKQLPINNYCEVIVTHIRKHINSDDIAINGR